MDILNAVGIKVNDLIGGVSNARLFHSRRIISKLIYKALKTLGHKGTGKADGALHLLGIGNGHNAGDHRNGNARFTDLILEIVQ